MSFDVTAAVLQWNLKQRVAFLGAQNHLWGGWPDQGRAADHLYVVFVCYQEKCFLSQGLRWEAAGDLQLWGEKAGGTRAVWSRSWGWHCRQAAHGQLPWAFADGSIVSVDCKLRMKCLSEDVLLIRLTYRVKCMSDSSPWPSPLKLLTWAHWFPTAGGEWGVNVRMNRLTEDYVLERGWAVFGRPRRTQAGYRCSGIRVHLLSSFILQHCGEAKI